MAPEIAFKALDDVPEGALIFDPMCGSGTTLKIASSRNYEIVGCDIDPLALLIAKVWCMPLKEGRIHEQATSIKERFNKITDVELPWIDKDIETNKFINFWFSQPQITALRTLTYLINQSSDDTREIMQVALSRIIITKSNGASLARDVSHGKPHKVKEFTNYDVLRGFEKSLWTLVSKLRNSPVVTTPNLLQSDARRLHSMANNIVDLIITSPPYLHAVDYMRGHRLSLVWLGYTLSELRTIRADTVGTPKRYEGIFREELIQAVGRIEHLATEKQKQVQKYAVDLSLICAEYHRVMKRGAHATVVIGDTFMAGVLIKNTEMFKNAAALAGLTLVTEEQRQILASKRYLPPPTLTGTNNLDKRMKTEAILTFMKE